MEDKRGKEGSFTPIIIVMIASLLIAFYWDKVDFIKDTAHSILNPSAGALLAWNLDWGMLIIVFFISLIMTIVQKYATDQATLKEMKNEQKVLQEEMKKFKDHPEKLMELQKKQFAFMGPMMKLSMRGVLYTGVPLILMFRWFNDYFVSLGSPKIFGFFTWFWFYLLVTMIFSSIMRKYMDVV